MTSIKCKSQLHIFWRDPLKWGPHKLVRLGSFPSLNNFGSSEVCATPMHSIANLDKFERAPPFINRLCIAGVPQHSASQFTYFQTPRHTSRVYLGSSYSQISTHHESRYQAQINRPSFLLEKLFFDETALCPSSLKSSSPKIPILNF